MRNFRFPAKRAPTPTLRKHPRQETVQYAAAHQTERFPLIGILETSAHE